jgi:hypothetical protein
MLVPVNEGEDAFNTATSVRVVVELTGHIASGARFYANVSSGSSTIGGKTNGETISNPTGENTFIFPVDFTLRMSTNLQLNLGYSYLAGESPWVLKDISFLIP